MEIERYIIEDMPFDMLFEICRLSESLALLTTSKNLNAHLTIGVTLDFMVFLGYDVRVSQICGNRSLLTWKLRGLMHRINFPAIEYSDGEKHWYLHGLLHREGGPAVDVPGKIKVWYHHGKRHRINGPAIMYDTGEEWYIKAKFDV